MTHFKHSHQCGVQCFWHCIRLPLYYFFQFFVLRFSCLWYSRLCTQVMWHDLLMCITWHDRKSRKERERERGEKRKRDSESARARACAWDLESVFDSGWCAEWWDEFPITEYVYMGILNVDYMRVHTRVIHIYTHNIHACPNKTKTRVHSSRICTYLYIHICISRIQYIPRRHM